MRKLITTLLIASPLIMLPAVSGAKGCLKGAAVGAVAGHVAGHHAGARRGGRMRSLSAIIEKKARDKAAAARRAKRRQPARPPSRSYCRAGSSQRLAAFNCPMAAESSVNRVAAANSPSCCTVVALAMGAVMLGRAICQASATLAAEAP